jgi:TonB family protein
MRHAEGAVQFRLEVDAQGRVTACTVTRSSGDSQLDETTCAILRERARYEPARSAEGRAVAGTDMGRVTWRMSSAWRGVPFRAMRIVTRMRRTADGVQCTVAADGVPAPGETRGECGYLVGSGAETWLRAEGAPRELLLVFAIGPGDSAGDAPGPDEEGLGRMGMETVASLSVAQDGQIIDCRPVRLEVQPGVGLTGTPNLCRFRELDGRPFFQPSPVAEPRRARIRMALFYR